MMWYYLYATQRNNISKAESSRVLARYFDFDAVGRQICRLTDTDLTSEPANDSLA